MVGLAEEVGNAARRCRPGVKGDRLGCCCRPRRVLACVFVANDNRHDFASDDFTARKIQWLAVGWIETGRVW